MKNAGKVRWGRVVIGAILVEVGLIVTTVPIQQLFGTPAFLAVIPVACLAIGFLFGWWAARKVDSRFILHGTLVGILATMIYVGLILSQLGSIGPVVEIYGPVLFIVVNGLRIFGCIAGSYVAERNIAARRAAIGGGL